MKYLLDTCALIWHAEGNQRLSIPARKIIADTASDCAVSTISFWEISVKSVLGKLSLRYAPVELGRRSEEDGLSILSLTLEHIDEFNRLPTAHRDPFDRLLAAVALAERRTFISPESTLDHLGISRLW